MRSQIRGLNKASSNAQDGVSLIQTAEGALNETHSILQRMNELAVQGANDTNQSIDRDAINQELDALVSEIDRISETTQFNKQGLLDGSFTGKQLQVGANQNQKITINIAAMNAKAIGLSKIKVDKVEGYIGTNEVIQNTKAATSGAIRVSVHAIASKNATVPTTISKGTKYFVTPNGTKATASTTVRACYGAKASAAAQVFVVNSNAATSVTKPNVKVIRGHEKNLEGTVEELVKTALETREIIEIE